jgi:hypothetical protein
VAIFQSTELGPIHGVNSLVSRLAEFQFGGYWAGIVVSGGRRKEAKEGWRDRRKRTGATRAGGDAALARMHEVIETRAIATTEMSIQQEH